MKNRNEQPSAKQRVNNEMQNRNDRTMKTKAENRVESCTKSKDMNNSTQKEMRAENNMQNNNMKNRIGE